jgi:hypothetical protein
VVAAGRLDLHDIRAERGEELCRRRPGERRRHVDDADAGEREKLAHRVIRSGAGQVRRLRWLSSPPEPTLVSE